MNVFDEYAIEYDRWFDIHRFTYQSEVETVRRCVPDTGLGVDIGVGTGRFSVPFSIIIGVDPSEGMAAIARSRGVTVHLARAEDLPFCAEHFDFALMITTLCFLDNPHNGLKEAYRILKPGGRLILGIIDRETQLGKYYESVKSSNKFYREAEFYSTAQVLDLLHSTDFNDFQMCQTIFSNPDMMTAPDPVLGGYGKGAFVVIRSIKQSKKT